MSGAANGHPLDQLSAYLDDALALEDRARIDRHLASCTACREELDGLRRLSRAIAGEPVPEPGAGLEQSVLRRIDAVTIVPFRRRILVPASIAATVAAVGLLAVVAWKQGGPDLVPRPEPARENAPAAATRQEPYATQEPTAPASSPAQPPPVPEETAGRPEPDSFRELGELRARKTKRDDVALDKISASGVSSQSESAAAVADAKDEDRPVAAGSVAARTRVAEAPPTAMPVRPTANTAVVLGGAESDSKLDARWEVADPVRAVSELAALAAKHGGREEPTEGRNSEVVTLVVPRDRFAAFVVSARAMGVVGLEDATASAEGGWIRQRIRVVTVSTP